MEYLKSILFHKSGTANKHHTYQSTSLSRLAPDRYSYRLSYYQISMAKDRVGDFYTILYITFFAEDDQLEIKLL